MAKDKITCPLMDKPIDVGTCFDVAMVAEHQAPPSTAPREATKREDYRDICLKCKHHKD